MSERYREHLQSLGFMSKRGASEKRVIRDERDGSVAGIETEHWDGSKDGAARPKTIRVKAKMLTEEVR